MIRVKATRIGQLGRQTATGHRLDLHTPLVALPDIGALGELLRVRNPATGRQVIAIVLDVGPWNEHDAPYVFGHARPAAESGTDTRGRTTNRAGIDLGERVWRELAMHDNGPVEWEFLEGALAMRYHVRIESLELEIDLEPIDHTEPAPAPAPLPPAMPAPAPGRELPPGYDSDPTVGERMLLETVRIHKLDPIAMQNHGAAIAAALNADWPGLDAYAHKVSDAIMWPGFGSLDVTKDSGKGGWYFRPDRVARYGEGRP